MPGMATLRRRTLLPSPAPALAPSNSKPPLPGPPWSEGECARILTRTPATGTRFLVVHIDRPLVLGRSPRADYMLDDPRASSRHARISATLSDTGHSLVAIADNSANGTLVNGRRLYHDTRVLSDGDRFEIAGQLFRYVHTAPVPPPAATATATAPYRVGAFLVYPRTLGSGAFSSVHLALDTRSLAQVACKKLARARIGKDRLAVIRREVDILQRATHPNINRIEAVHVDELAVHIFLELVPGGDLFTYLIKHGHLDAPESKWLLYQLLLALEYLHDELGIAHRDVKLENVVLAFTCPGTGGRFPKAQLADFGQAKQADERFRSLQGTLQYMAPEQLVAWTRHEGYDGKKADMWALGILLAHLLTGSHPFEPFPSTLPPRPPSDSEEDLGASVAHELAANPADDAVVRRVVRGAVALPASLGGGAENGAVRTLLATLLAQDPAHRATAAQALRSEWVTESKGELEELWGRVVGGGGGGGAGGKRGAPRVVVREVGGEGAAGSGA